jgi:hypothetical protein
LRMGKTIRIDQAVIAVHLVMTGYGHWLSNDPRGSGSTQLRQEKFEDLGPVHFGRKRKQPTKRELREFYKEAEKLLEYDTLWFDARVRRVIAQAFEQVCADRRYVAWACAVLQNHGHLVLRTHKDRGHLMWEYMVIAARDALRREALIPKDHPVWSNRPYVVFKTTVPQVENAVEYVDDNPEKHGLSRQV